MLKRILSILLLIAASFCISGCQTLGGIGGDLKWTGEQVEAGAANCSIPPADDKSTN